MSRHRRHRSRRRHREPVASPPPAESSQLDRLGPDAALAADAAAAARRKPPKLIVESRERVAARQARDVRDGVKKADRRGLLYLGIAVLVALVVFGILSLIDSRALR